MSYVHPPSDVSAAESHSEGGHGGLLGKLKDKTKKATSKIKTKVGRRHDDPTDTDPHHDEEEYEESPTASSPLTPSGTHATPYDQKSYDSKPSAFDVFENPAPASSYTNTPAPLTSFQSDQSQPSPITSYKESQSSVPLSSYSPYESQSQDISAGVPYDSSYNKVQESDAVIPEGILKAKPRDFDTEGDYPAGSTGVDEPNPSPYATGTSGDINAGTPFTFGDNKVDESETKIPEGIVKPIGSTTPEFTPQTDDDVYNKSEDSEKVNDGAYYSKFGAEGALGRSLGGKDDDELSARERMSKSGHEDTGFGTSAYDTGKDTKDTIPSELGEGYEKAKDNLGMNQPFYESTSDYPDVPRNATDATYQANDNVQEKAHDINNATDDNQTYTQKASNTMYAAKDKVADTLGMNQPSTGPTITERAKDTLGMNQPSTGPTLTERAKDSLGMNQPSTGPSVVDQAKGYLGVAADTTRDQATRAKEAVASSTGAATDTSKDYTSSTADTTKDVTGTAADRTRDSAYEAKDAAQGKAADLNNATNDSETYTQKAANTAYDVKDKAVNALGLNQPSTGPSLMDQAKGYLGGAADTTKDNVQRGTDTTRDYAGSAADNTREGLNQPSGGSLMDTIKGYTGFAKDTTKDNAQRATDATNDYAESAAENTRQGLDKSSTGPSLLDQAKGYLGAGADTTKEYTGSAADTSNEYAGKAYDNTAQSGQTVKDKVAGNAAVARDVAAENAVVAKDKAAEAAQRASEVAKDYGAKTYDTSAQYGQVAKEKAAETAAVAKDKAVEVTTPKPEDKALSEKITEALSNLPFQAKDTAATTAQNVAQTTSDKAHEEAHKDTVLGRLTGLLGFGSKQPAHHDVNPASQVTKDHTSAVGPVRDDVSTDVASAAPHDVSSSGPTQ